MPPARAQRRRAVRPGHNLDAVPIFFFAFFSNEMQKKVQNARFTQYATVSR
jgi:hypothetical protein